MKETGKAFGPGRVDINKIHGAWISMSSADRHALLGHDRDELTPADKIRIAQKARALGQAVRAGKPVSFAATLGPKHRGVHRGGHTQVRKG